MQVCADIRNDNTSPPPQHRNTSRNSPMANDLLLNSGLYPNNFSLTITWQRQSNHSKPWKILPFFHWHKCPKTQKTHLQSSFPNYKTQPTSLLMKGKSKRLKGGAVPSKSAALAQVVLTGPFSDIVWWTSIYWVLMTLPRDYVSDSEGGPHSPNPHPQQQIHPTPIYLPPPTHLYDSQCNGLKSMLWCFCLMQNLASFMDKNREWMPINTLQVTVPRESQI